MRYQSRPDRVAFAVIVLGTAAVACLAFAHVEAVAPTGDDVLGVAAPLVEALLTVGGTIHRGASVAEFLRLPLLTVILAWRGIAWWRGRAVSPFKARLAGLGLAAAAQSWAMDGMAFAAVGAYGSGVAMYLSARPPPLPPRPSSTVAAAAVLLMGSFVAAGLYRLEVQPDLYVDERAYLAAARMNLGELPGGDFRLGLSQEMYILERFEAQAVPLALHSAAVAISSPGILPIRLASLLAMTLALLIVYVVFCSRFGSAAGLAMIAFVASSPFVLTYARAGLYIAPSVLHGVVCAAVLLWMWHRWSFLSAFSLGVALGSVVFFYQVSWFCPILAACTLAVWPETWRREGAARRAMLALAVASLVAVSGPLLFPEGWRQLWKQSFNQAGWGAKQVELGAATFLARDAQHGQEQALIEADSLSGLTPAWAYSKRGHRLLVLAGPTAKVESAMRSLDEREWLLLRRWGHWTDPDSPLDRISEGLERLLGGRPGWESHARLVDTGLLNPALVPLLVLGVAAALRRGRDPYARLLVVWTLAGGLLPVAVAGVLPRRSVLALPFAQVLMALPIAELLASAPQRVRRLTAAACTTLVAAAFALGIHLYFTHWGIEVGTPQPGGHLGLTKVLRGLDPADPVLVAARLRGARPFLEQVEEEPLEGPANRITLVPDPGRAVQISCDREPPFSWVVFDDEEGVALERVLERRFVTSLDVKEGFRVVRIDASRAGGCRQQDPVLP